jgi:hypothetical protein
LEEYLEKKKAETGIAAWFILKSRRDQHG